MVEEPAQEDCLGGGWANLGKRVLPASERPLNGAPGDAKVLGDGPDGFSGLVEESNPVPVVHARQTAKPPVP